MKIQIKSKNNNLLFELDQEENSLRITLEIAVKRGADLRGADLRGADLGGADLSDAYLGGADLSDADLDLIKSPPTNSHFFISELLFRNAKKEKEKNFAGRIRIETNLCWEEFALLAKKMKVVKWAKDILFRWPEYKEKIDETEKSLSPKTPPNGVYI